MTIENPLAAKVRRWPKYAEPSPEEPQCICPFVDVGVGPLMQHGVDPDCPVCNDLSGPCCTCQDYRKARTYTRVEIPFGGLLGTVRLKGGSVESWPTEGSEIDPCCEIHGE